MSSPDHDLAYRIAKAPIDLAINAGQVAVWPIHFGKTLATNAVDTAFRILGTSTEDKPLEHVEGESIYDMAEYSLNVASMIYYFTELRAEIKVATRALAQQKGISMDFSSPTCQLLTLANAIYKVKGALEELSEDPETTDGTTKMKNYQDALDQLNGLAKDFNVDTGELEVFTTYFEILDQPKDLASIYGDLIRFDKFIDPQFRLAFGGSTWNRNNVSKMISSGYKSYVHRIDDDFTTTSTDIEGLLFGFWNELLWAIVVCEKTKKVTVVFRGSVNTQDWIKNLTNHMVPCQFPGFTTAETANDPKETFGNIHKGFYQYLFGKTKKGSNGSTKSKGEEIIGILKAEIFDEPEYADYSLEVTGHSLGGALSTLFAMRCAALDDFPGKTITNISFASPYVGDEEFRQAFVDLERNRKIRHLRIANDQDMVPLLPPFSFDLPPKQFKHVGMNIRLYEGGDLAAPKYRRFYPKKDAFVNNVRNTLSQSLTMGLSVGIIEKHLCPEYCQRLESAKEDLEKLTLDQLYSNKEITGWSFVGEEEEGEDIQEIPESEVEKKE
eukprot:CAMPEP_0116132440 /NCGR_PEP_ID=MMETSP0329-20121206/9547_1 /TAXON_ID=697910 /ORGANISM="Pseudo-nitzschia arenysensis, Strain B593" /LENGTH=553 /DNA_ID=CAMNT_0003626951 /DNA_START=108 /DNA_END=1769 /DNA_ORIENTATION=-